MVKTEIAATRAGLDWSVYQHRYSQGEWRARIFRDLVLADVKAMCDRPSPVLLDIGCGHGFDNDADLQSSLAAAAGEYIGVEPDPDVTLSPMFTQSHRCMFEDAPILPGSVDVAFAVMVVEHLKTPEAFWGHVHEVLRPGGVFWAFTVDARHWFAKASLLAERINAKGLYFGLVYGRKPEQHYDNYPVHYRSNTPKQIESLTAQFSARDYINFGKIGQMDHYLPRIVRPINHAVDRVMVRRGAPGGNLAIRVVK
jgi:SAM-dependent methyltransferase